VRTTNKQSRLFNKIQCYRKKLGLSQQQLAEQIGVKRSTIAMIETGKIMPSLRTALRLSRILGAPVEELFPVEDKEGDRE